MSNTRSEMAVLWLRQLVSGLTAEAWLQCQPILCGICGEPSGTGSGLCQYTFMLPVTVIAQMLHTHSSVTSAV